MRERAAAHLQGGGAVARIPHANQLWMLVGLALFARLKREFERLKVYPHAIVRALDLDVPHKSTPAGIRRQLALAADATGVAPRQFERAAWGGCHDRIDAVLSAGVASLPPERRVAYGDGGATRSGCVHLRSCRVALRRLKRGWARRTTTSRMGSCGGKAGTDAGRHRATPAGRGRCVQLAVGP